MMADVIVPPTSTNLKPNTFMQDLMMEYPCNPEEMSGCLTLLSSDNTTQAVIVKVYRTAIDHFAVVYPDKRDGRPLGVLNLKHTQVELLEIKEGTGFIVRQCGFDTPLCSIKFLTQAADQILLNKWISAFSNKAPTRYFGTSLPTLEEEEV